MEDELKCPYCAEFYCNPVLLPCSHSLCYACALHLQEKFNTSSTNPNKPSKDITSAIANAAKSASTIIALSSPQSISSSSSTNLSTTDLGSSIISDLDKLSVFSEADSGVSSNNSILLNHNSSPTSSSSNSRPCSYMSQCSPAPDHYLNISRQLLNKASSSSSQAKSIHSLSTLAPSSPNLPPAPPLPFTSTLYSTFLPCPQCSRMIYMDETGVDSLVKNTCLENIVERYTESKKLSIKCQMCPPGSLLGEEASGAEESRLKDAAFMCEQCEIYYCEDCRESCHPMRGPLQKHVVVAPKLGRDLIKKKNRIKESKCGDHVSEQVSLYCLLCKSSCCGLCVNDTAHINHQMQPINQFCRSQKVNSLNFFVLF